MLKIDTLLITIYDKIGLEGSTEACYEELASLSNYSEN